jgi:hypothetical protein
MMPDRTTNPHDPRAERLAALKREYAERRASLPAHSVSAAHLIRLEELEDAIAALRAEIASDSAPSS